MVHPLPLLSDPTARTFLESLTTTAWTILEALTTTAPVFEVLTVEFEGETPENGRGGGETLENGGLGERGDVELELEWGWGW